MRTKLGQLIAHDVELQQEYDERLRLHTVKTKRPLEIEIVGWMRENARLRADVEEMETILQAWQRTTLISRLLRLFRRQDRQTSTVGAAHHADTDTNAPSD